MEPKKLFQVGRDSIIYSKKYWKQNKNGILNLSNKTPYIEFPTLQQIPFIKHGFSTRLGGVSKEHLASLNLSFIRNDEPEHVYMNYQRICDAIGIKIESLVFSDQVHDTKIHRVTKKDLTGNSFEKQGLKGIDGLVTDEPGVTLVTSYADCVPLFFVDTKERAIGLSHSGWRGTVGRIGAKTVQTMKNEFGTNPENLIAVIGPSICQECYEVSKDVALQFESEFLPEQIDSVLIKKENGKYQLDLWRANQIILAEAGIPQENISVAGICTCCNNGLLFSHRASQGMRGNLNGFLQIVE